MTRRLDKWNKAALGRRTAMPRAIIEAHLHLTTTAAAKVLGVTSGYLRQRARTLCLQFHRPGEMETEPEVLDRRCPCGTIFQCHDIRKERVCPACEEAMAA